MSIVQRFKEIITKDYTPLGSVEINLKDENLNFYIISVKTNFGWHKDKEFILNLKFNDTESWPRITLDSELFRPYFTKNYLENKGFRGTEHKGICVKHISYGYSYNHNFKKYCVRNWGNYVFLIISSLSDKEYFEKGNGLNFS
tara:strand:- start:631 stop:1059 length:429 start_codon:yes stop_codon:yes gene_type:complete